MYKRRVRDRPLRRGRDRDFGVILGIGRGSVPGRDRGLMLDIDRGSVKTVDFRQLQIESRCRIKHSSFDS